jgi:hypothetical protein
MRPARNQYYYVSLVRKISGITEPLVTVKIEQYQEMKSDCPILNMGSDDHTCFSHDRATVFATLISVSHTKACTHITHLMIWDVWRGNCRYWPWWALIHILSLRFSKSMYLLCQCASYMEISVTKIAHCLCQAIRQESSLSYLCLKNILLKFKYTHYPTKYSFTLKYRRIWHSSPVVDRPNHFPAMSVCKSLLYAQSQLSLHLENKSNMNATLRKDTWL